MKELLTVLPVMPVSILGGTEKTFCSQPNMSDYDAGTPLLDFCIYRVIMQSNKILTLNYVEKLTKDDTAPPTSPLLTLTLTLPRRNPESASEFTVEE